MSQFFAVAALHVVVVAVIVAVIAVDVVAVMILKWKIYVDQFHEFIWIFSFSRSFQHLYARKFLIFETTTLTTLVLLCNGSTGTPKTH